MLRLIYYVEELTLFQQRHRKSIMACERRRGKTLAGVDLGPSSHLIETGVFDLDHHHGAPLKTWKLSCLCCAEVPPAQEKRLMISKKRQTTALGRWRRL